MSITSHDERFTFEWLCNYLFNDPNNTSSSSPIQFNTSVGTTSLSRYIIKNYTDFEPQNFKWPIYLQTTSENIINNIINKNNKNLQRQLKTQLTKLERNRFVDYFSDKYSISFGKESHSIGVQIFKLLVSIQDEIDLKIINYGFKPFDSPFHKSYIEPHGIVESKNAGIRFIPLIHNFNSYSNYITVLYKELKLSNIQSDFNNFYWIFVYEPFLSTQETFIELREKYRAPQYLFYNLEEDFGPIRDQLIEQINLV